MKKQSPNLGLYASMRVVKQPMRFEAGPASGRLSKQTVDTFVYASNGTGDVVKPKGDVVVKPRASVEAKATAVPKPSDDCPKGMIGIGELLQILWTEQRKTRWYRAEVLSYNHDTQEHTVFFCEDRTCTTLQLSKVQWKVDDGRVEYQGQATFLESNTPTTSGEAMQSILDEL